MSVLEQQTVIPPASIRDPILGRVLDPPLAGHPSADGLPTSRRARRRSDARAGGEPSRRPASPPTTSSATAISARPTSSGAGISRISFPHRHRPRRRPRDADRRLTIKGTSTRPAGLGRRPAPQPAAIDWQIRSTALVRHRLERPLPGGGLCRRPCAPVTSFSLVKQSWIAVRGLAISGNLRGPHHPRAPARGGGSAGRRQPGLPTGWRHCRPYGHARPRSVRERGGETVDRRHRRIGRVRVRHP